MRQPGACGRSRIPEALFVAHARVDREDILGRQHGADDLQRLAFTIEQCDQTVARLQLARLGKSLANQHLVRFGQVDPAAGHQREPIHAWQAVLGQRDHATGEWLEHAREIDEHVVGQRRVHFGDARDVEEIGLDIVGVRRAAANTCAKRALS